ncbi:class A beta-lactamase [Actinomycetospora termitidis]|uniref:Beta-lactamase n=1 Tax=Actinomycetospora termitidis TaxID=3053470 RepID=A0ABT7MDC2_9PSEU|nr:class A beta-lactamase [Actinomycetospora sp. Odt1-22]MDL5157378.1 class A beta-lactamase [Actinomycetospora sp. Odt1-22]
MPPSRRRVLVLGAAALAAGCAPTPASAPAPPAVTNDPFAPIEAGFVGRLGVFALDTATGRTVGHRADERFLMCSTSKMPTAAAILAARVPLDEVVRYSAGDLVRNSPTTSRATAMTIRDLCAAAITVSDNTAENLLLRRLGGPKAVEAYVRSIGDGVSSFDRTEPDLNVRTGTLDTSTPRQMAATLQACTLGAGLDDTGRRQLTAWLVANTTGGPRIRAGLPPGWRTGDKTGSGDGGEVNDVAITWPPAGDAAQRSSTPQAGDAAQRSSTPQDRGPLLVAVYTEPADPTSQRNVPAVPAAAAAAIRALGF